MRIPLIILLCAFSLTIGSAQYAHEDVFQNDRDQGLLTKLVANFKPTVVLDYSHARDTMFTKVYNVNDSIYGIYSNHRLFLPKGVDPTTALYMNGIADGINTEHVYPQSKGAENGNARSDMHHIFPSRTSTNEERGSMPFAEVNDNQTTKWFYQNIETDQKPTTNRIDLYSEKGFNAWEPRESVEGDIARAMFYFYTMYEDFAMQADPQFFEAQRAQLCEWHYSDPVDSLEWVRNIIKATYQDGKRNPYILDCSLAERTFCDRISEDCQLVDNKNINFDIKTLVDLIENPVNQRVRVQNTNLTSEANYKIFNIGQTHSLINGILKPTEKEHIINIDFLPPGMYFMWIMEENSYTQQVIKFVKTN